MVAATVVRAPSDEHPQYIDAFWFKYTLSVTAAAVAETTTYPLDIVKTRLQIQGEQAAKGHIKDKRGFFRSALGIIREEGFFRLWNGIPPAIYRHLIYSGCRMTFYEYVRDKFFRKESQSAALWKSVMVGILAGSIGQFLASPADLVKVQMQTEGRRRLQGLPPRVTSTWQAWQKIYSEGGIRGLWKGWAPNVYRAALVNLGDLTTYDTSKRLILKHTNLKDNYFSHSLASALSGFVAATLGTPADVIRTRVMNQPTDSKGRGVLYSSSYDCLMKTLRNEGFFALYKGFFPIWARMAPWSFTFWVTYEELRRFTGVKSF